MEWADNLRREVEKLINRFNALDQKVDATVKESASNSRQQADYTRNMANYTSTAESLLNELKRLRNDLPKSIKVENEYKWGIRLPTMAWITGIVLAVGLGFWFAPEVISTAENQKLYWQLQRREYQIREFQKVHPKYTRQYFGD